VRGEPDVGKKFIELNRGMGRQATEDIAEVTVHFQRIQQSG
jgi:hypothetical protein